MSDWIARVGAAGVLPVVELPDGADPVALVDALLAGGVDCIEVTLRTAGAVGAIEAIRDSGRDVLVAAGTVLTIDQATEALDNGAQLLVAPGYSAAVVRWAAGHGAPILPGASTPTEIQMGMADGVDTFKFFPAEAAGGAAYLAAMAGPYPSVRFVPTGGIDSGNLDRYLALRNVLACGGSWMVNRRLLETGDLAAVTTLTLEASAVVRRARIDEVAG